MDLNNRIDIGKSATRMTVTLHRLKSEEMRKLEVRGQEWLRANAPDLVSLVPNLIPAAMAFGVWGYVYGKVGNGGSLVTAIAFGTVVDDTIHFMSKYLKARREGLSASEAVRAAFRAVGRALFTTTMILVLGFLVFASSGFVISWMLGLLVALTIGFALICDFLLLPPLLIAIDRKTQ